MFRIPNRSHTAVTRALTHAADPCVGALQAVKIKMRTEGQNPDWLDLDPDSVAPDGGPPPKPPSDAGSESD